VGTAVSNSSTTCRYEWAFHNRFVQRALPRYPTAGRLGPASAMMRAATAPLRWVFWRQVELCLLLHWRLPRRLWPRTPFDRDMFTPSASLCTGPYFREVRRGGIAVHVASVARIGPHCVTIREQDTGAESDVPADTIVLATGYEFGLKPLDAGIASMLAPQEDGVYLYKHIVSPDVPGVAFVGAAITFTAPLTFSIQAAWLGELLLGHFALPSADAMRENIHRRQAVQAGWPMTNVRSGVVAPHGDMYHEELLEDIGARKLTRYGGPFGPVANLLLPAKAADCAEAMKPVSQRSRRCLRPPALLKAVTVAVLSVIFRAVRADRVREKPRKRDAL
jgi:dimethylaniline monooxygenase (N-oxide forming)